MKPTPLTVAGIMSGTSADGMDVAIVHIAPGRTKSKGKSGAASFGAARFGGASLGSARPTLTLLAHEGFAYPAPLRRAVLEAMNATAISTADLARLNWRLGVAYAEAVRATLKKHRIQVDLIGCHGQTLYHQAQPAKYLGASFTCTWQAGEPAVIAQELGIPVASNFRPADMVAGGQGAPLVPLLDYVLFADAKRGRVLQNVGGIANLTAIPADAQPQAVLAFDTGPGNMVMDALAAELFGKKYDRNGALAARGTLLNAVLNAELRNPYFALKPPRTTGREQFGREYTTRFLAACRKHSPRPEDALATATAFTAESIAQSYVRFAASRMKGAPVDYIVSGGGARNATLMAMLSQRLTPLGCELTSIDGFGLPAEAKEAAAFALLAWHTWHRLPANVPAATGAKRPVVLGQITYV